MRRASSPLRQAGEEDGHIEEAEQRDLPTNSFRLVVSPSLAISFGYGKNLVMLLRGYVQVLKRVMNNARVRPPLAGRLLHREEDEDQRHHHRWEVPLSGRQQHDLAQSTEAPNSVDSMMIPLELCSLTDADFNEAEI